MYRLPTMIVPMRVAVTPRLNEQARRSQDAVVRVISFIAALVVP